MTECLDAIVSGARGEVISTSEALGWGDASGADVISG